MTIRLDPTEEQADFLRQRLQRYLELCNTVSERTLVLPAAAQRNAIRMHHQLYRSLRQQYSDLGSRDIMNAFRVVALMNKSKSKRLYNLQRRMEWYRQHNRVIPHQLITAHRHLTNHPSRFTAPTIPIFSPDTYALKREKRYVSLLTLRGHRFHVRFTACKYSLAVLDTGELTRTAYLQYDYAKRQWRLRLLLKCPVPKRVATGILGIDQGMEQLLTTSDGVVLHDPEWLRKARHKFALRKDLLRKVDNGSRSAKRRLQQSSGRQFRYVNDVCHRLSKKLIAHACSHQYSILALEILTYIKHRNYSTHTKYVLWYWPQALLEKCIKQKAEANGLTIVHVPPATTSITCSKCGYQHKKARITRQTFRCPYCGDMDADINAARNIAALAAQRCVL